MFKKLLSNLPFNPSLIQQVSFYSKRLKAESSIRRLGVAFLVLALGVQIFAATLPSEPTLAASGNDIVYGGRDDKGGLVDACNQNVQNFHNILLHFQADCIRIYAGQDVTLRSNDYGGQLYSLGRSPTGFAGEQSVFVDGTEYFMKPLDAWGTTSYKAIKGTRYDGTPFWVLLDCANIVIVGPPAPPPPPPPPPPIGIKCDTLMMSVRSGATVPAKTTIQVRGRAVGQNLPDNQHVIMRYAMTGPSTDNKEGRGIAFDGTTATDPNWRPFKLNRPGTYKFTLAVSYEGGDKAADGNKQGDCVKEVTVREQPPCKDNDNDDSTICVVANKTATNNTQNNGDAHGTVANPGDEITYTLVATNTSINNRKVKDFVIQENISDVLEYADISNLHGGTIGDDNTVRWPAVTISPGEKVEKQITVKVKADIPSTPSPSSNPGSFDCKMTNVYGDTVDILLPCSPEKRIEQASGSLPNTGPGETLAVAFLVTTVAGYFFARSRLMAKELDILRSDFANSGGN